MNLFWDNDNYYDIYDWKKDSKGNYVNNKDGSLACEVKREKMDPVITVKNIIPVLDFGNIKESKDLKSLKQNYVPAPKSK